MRTIKFRVYNKDWKMMVQPEDILAIHFGGVTSESVDVSFNITTTDGVRNRNVWEGTEDIVFMQYTGLKDKNDIEIYEGDLVKYADIKTSSVYEIFFEDKECMYLMAPNSNKNEEATSFLRGHLEVVGNVYEENKSS
jgi:uncharacterized phage protein (TIGR01671 family)